MPIPRRVLAFYDGAIELKPSDTRIHRYAEMPLNYLGYYIEYRNLLDPLPDSDALDGVAGILTWFGGTTSNTRAFLPWAAKIAGSGKRFVIMGSLGGDFWSGDLPALNAFLEPLGLRHDNRAVELTFGTTVELKRRALVSFERELGPVVPPYQVVRAVSSKVEIWSSLRVPRREGSGEAVTVSVGPSGGYAAHLFELAVEPGIGRARWLIDPFAFFKASLGGLPLIPDTSTMSGRRLFYVHVDGEGLNNVVADKFGVRRLLPAVFEERIVLGYPNIPLTFSVAAGDLDPALGGNATPAEVVQRIWSHPQVEPGIAPYTRPFSWTFFEDYSRDREEHLIERHAQAERSAFGQIAGYLLQTGSTERYIAAGRELPRTYLREPFKLEHEIVGSWQALRALAPATKVPRIFAWTGDAKPFEAAIALTRKLSLANVGGGETRFDASYPSIAHVAPIAKQVGGERQIYSAFASEVSYDKDWRPADTALEQLGASFANTERPRRLKPIGLHLNLASFVNPTIFTRVETYLRTFDVGPLAPVSTLHYAAIASSFDGVRIEQVRDLTWVVHNLGSIETLRVDDAQELELDPDGSEGVLGSRRVGTVLYVTLDSGRYVQVSLKKVSGSPVRRVSLKEARWRVFGLSRQDNRWSFNATGFGRGEFVWEHVPQGCYRINAQGAEDVATVTEVCSENQQLSFTLERSGLSTLFIEAALRTEPDPARHD